MNLKSDQLLRHLNAGDPVRFERMAIVPLTFDTPADVAYLTIDSEQESFEPVGVGTSVRITGSDAVGAALLYNEQLIHLSLFADAQPQAPSEP